MLHAAALPSSASREASDLPDVCDSSCPECRRALPPFPPAQVKLQTSAGIVLAERSFCSTLCAALFLGTEALDDVRDEVSEIRRRTGR